MKAAANCITYTVTIVAVFGCFGETPQDLDLVDIPGGAIVMGHSAGEPDEAPGPPPSPDSD